LIVSRTLDHYIPGLLFVDNSILMGGWHKNICDTIQKWTFSMKIDIENNTQN
jgi:hypothetical protein